MRSGHRRLHPLGEIAKYVVFGVAASCICHVGASFALDAVYGSAKLQTAMLEQQRSTSQGAMVDKSADVLADRALETSQLHGDKLDDSTLGKPGHLAIRARAGSMMLFPSRSYSRRHVGGGSGSPWAGYRPQRVAVTKPTRQIHAAAGPSGFGLSPEVDARMADGSMTFEDFIEAMDEMNRLRRVEARTNQLEAPALVDEPGMPKNEFQEVEDKTNTFRKLVERMTDEERATPDLFFDEDNDERTARIDRISSEAGEDPGVLLRLLYEFYMMREMESRLAKGESIDEIQKDLMREDRAPVQDLTSPGNREQRRMAKRQNKKKEAKKEGGGFR
eukprot:gnl/TRDRNA2_/TRDRNA2_33094_c0_seq1.p1 gnl/TRDRNA2_/TRDRNA2_33094_c0~~gnl/TRDRNA2_/TRDRNA2_33094_c0_seq1.p1  ORF type:complete len:332 (+),score=62.26 gnl/TRDRNA2_/TRDRNA2_33094_c0_seq1:66-1061(+)